MNDGAIHLAQHPHIRCSGRTRWTWIAPDTIDDADAPTLITAYDDDRPLFTVVFGPDTAGVLADLAWCVERIRNPGVFMRDVNTGGRL